LSLIEKKNRLPHRALLPAGFKDQLPSMAAHESFIVHSIIERCEAYGYERIKPPLVEFEDSLFNGAGVSMTENSFRLMDPASGKMMGIRADMTVARIATTRLAHLERPLRLCYSGEVLRAHPDNLNPDRELVQVGAELIGPNTVTADLEVIQIALDALKRLGTKNISIDITAPALIPLILRSAGLDPASSLELRGALDRKDIKAVESLAGKNATLLSNIMTTVGAWEVGIKKLRELTLPIEVIEIIDRLENVASLISSESDIAEVTIDPIENRGFEYYNGIGFSFFSRGIRGELGRGGRYSLEDGSSQSSCGFSLYIETLLRALNEPTKKNRLLIPVNTNRKIIMDFQAAGWLTVIGLEDITDERKEAERLGCSHFLKNGQVETI
jgi:ATP phosphoribosyltransferase regulatory subunit